MNWTWNLRSSDGGMNGLEFARCLTAGGLSRVLVHAAPAKLSLEIIADGEVHRAEVWPPPDGKLKTE